MMRPEIAAGILKAPGSMPSLDPKTAAIIAILLPDGVHVFAYEIAHAEQWVKENAPCEVTATFLGLADAELRFVASDGETWAAGFVAKMASPADAAKTRFMSKGGSA